MEDLKKIAEDQIGKLKEIQIKNGNSTEEKIEASKEIRKWSEFIFYINV